MNKTLGIIGSGDLGQQIAHYAISDQHYKAVIYFDDFTNEKEKHGHPVAGKTSDVLRAYQQNQFDELLIAIGYKHIRQKEKIFRELKDQIPFGKIIHSSCWVDETAQVAPGCVIYPNCTLDAWVKIEANTLLNVACSISHDTQIGENCFLSPRVAIAGFVRIQSGCIIGINATLIDNLNISAQTQIGGGAVVIKNISQSGLYVGNPARYVRDVAL